MYFYRFSVNKVAQKCAVTIAAHRHNVNIHVINRTFLIFWCFRCVW